MVLYKDIVISKSPEYRHAISFDQNDFPVIKCDYIMDRIRIQWKGSYKINRNVYMCRVSGARRILVCHQVLYQDVRNSTLLGMQIAFHRRIIILRGSQLDARVLSGHAAIDRYRTVSPKLIVNLSTCYYNILLTGKRNKYKKNCVLFQRGICIGK